MPPFLSLREFFFEYFVYFVVPSFQDIKADLGRMQPLP
jgi:hypothetical protein